MHGDDFLSTGSDGQLKWLKMALEAKYDLKTEMLGPGATEKREVRILNRVIRWGSPGVEFEADPRHSEILVEQLGLSEAKGVSTPGVREEKKKGEKSGKDENEKGEEKRKRRSTGGKKEEEEDRGERDEGKDEGEDERMSPEAATQYRSAVARANFLAQDRPELLYAVKEASRSTSDPRHGDWQKLKRIGRFLKARPRVVQHFGWQNKKEEDKVKTWSDSDWAGCTSTRKSSSGGVVSISGHTLKAYSATQNVIARSSAEAEFYALVKSASVGLGVQSMARNSGEELSVELNTDSTAAMGIAYRLGLGRVRHAQTQQLWVQQKILNKEIELKKVLACENVADLMTKHVAADLAEYLMEGMEYYFVEGRPSIAPRTMKSATKAEEYQKSAANEFELNVCKCYEMGSQRAWLQDPGLYDQRQRCLRTSCPWSS